MIKMNSTSSKTLKAIKISPTFMSKQHYITLQVG